MKATISIFKRKKSKQHRQNVFIIRFLTVLFIACVVLARIYGETETTPVSVRTYGVIRGVVTEEKKYALAVCIDESASTQDIILLGKVLKGFSVEATFFADIDWIENNTSTVDSLSQSGQRISLVIKEDTGELNRNAAMRFLALQNDKFYSKTGVYPKYVMLKSEDSGKLPEVLYAFCQYYIESASVITEENALDSGRIVEISQITGDTPYEAASLIAASKADGFSMTSLKELLYDIESEVNENGYQIKQ